MNNLLNKVLVLLFAVFLLVSVLMIFGIFSGNNSWSLFFNSTVFSSSTQKINYDDYLGKSVLMYGHLILEPVLCRAERDCDYNVIFIDAFSSFSNFSVYKDGRALFCYDEYSKEPRKYLQVTCGLKYLDRSINREKFEIVPLEFTSSRNYTFTFMRNLNEYYLDMS